jgi:hypothetical protein
MNDDFDLTLERLHAQESVLLRHQSTPHEIRNIHHGEYRGLSIIEHASDLVEVRAHDQKRPVIYAADEASAREAIDAYLWDEFRALYPRPYVSKTELD